MHRDYVMQFFLLVLRSNGVALFEECAHRFEESITLADIFQIRPTPYTVHAVNVLHTLLKGADEMRIFFPSSMQRRAFVIYGEPREAVGLANFTPSCKEERKKVGETREVKIIKVSKVECAWQRILGSSFSSSQFLAMPFGFSARV